MTWRVAGVLVCLLSLVGCSNDVEKPAAAAGQRVEIRAPGGKILIHNPVQNLEQQRVTADVERNGVRYTLRVMSTIDGAGVSGGTTELLDESGDLLFAIESRVDDTTGEVVVTHRTPEDYLAHGIIADEERVREQYDANGDIAVFEYATISEEDRRHAANYYRHGLPAQRLPAPLAEFVRELAAFDSYYEPHSRSTVHDNPDGRLLLQIITSPELKELNVGPGAERWVWVDNVCNLARACQGLICYTRPDSLACFACTVISVACSIMDVICNWLGC